MKKIFQTVGYIFIRDRKILLVRAREKSVFYMPGGRRERGETLHEALVREIQEELSVDLIAYSLNEYGVFKAQAHGAPDGVMVKMHCFTGEFVGTLKPSSEIEEMHFFSYDEYLHMPEIAQAGRLILTDLHEKALID